MPAVVAAVAAAAMAAGSAMAASNSAEAPAPRDLNREAWGNTRTQINLAPLIYDAEAEYQPKYAALGVKNIRTAMNGTATDPGLLDLYENSILPVQQRVDAATMAAQREQDVGAFEQYAPRLSEAMRSADPRSAALRDLMQQQALQELQMGSSLTPEERRQLVQSAAAAQATGGRGYQPFSLAERMMTQGSAGTARQAQRRAFAAQMLSMGNNSTGLTQQLLAQPNRVGNISAQGFMQGAGSVPTQTQGQYSPFPQYASDLNNTNYNAEAAANIANFNQRAALAQGIMSAGGGLAMGYAGSGAAWGSSTPSYIPSTSRAPMDMQGWDGG